MLNRIYRVTASRLNIRPRPRVEVSSPLTQLLRGQAVVRLDEADLNGWWLVFADVAGDGVYVGYVASQYLESIDIDIQPAPAVDISSTPAPAPDAPVTPSNTHEDEHDLGENPFIDGGWNPLIPTENRIPTTHHSSREGAPIRRIIIHITGTDNYDSVKSTFTTGSAKTSAHYVIQQDGTISQFVPETRAAHHSGIRYYIASLYENGSRHWRKYLRYFSWSSRYPDETSVYLDKFLNVVEKGPDAALVVRRDGSDWPDFDYFEARWPGQASPVGFEEDDGRPNDHSIGIEIVSFGQTQPDSNAYSEAMYASLAMLVDDICERHDIPKRPPFVVGHEDVNPVERWGWDPGQGFEWHRILDNTTS